MVAQHKSGIKGKVIEYRTKQPLAGATIAIREKNMVTVTDSTGIFFIPNLPAGTYSITITSIGYYDKTLNDINIVPGKVWYFETELTEETVKLSDVTVRAFKGENNPQMPVSAFALSREEIFRSPGAQGDIFRAIGILPGW